jgi:hypothetical protein
MADRERTLQLAKTNTPAAVAAAREIRDPWARCQALAWVARFAPDGMVSALAEEALSAADAGADRYQQVAVAAWPVRALIERSQSAPAEAALRVLIPRASGIAHAGSRAEALLLLLQAASPGSVEPGLSVLRALLSIPHPPIHWRHRRALREAFRLLRPAGEDVLRKELGKVIDEKTRRQIESALDGAERAVPRAFFW